MIVHLSINKFIEKYPEEKSFKVFRVTDKYLFKVKEIKGTTVILNTHVNLEIPRDTEEYLVHESSYGQDYTIPKIQRYAPSELNKPSISLNIKKELTTRLHNETTFVFGRLLRERFYPFGKDLHTVDFSDLITQITYDYEFDPTTNEVVYRLETMSWFNELDEVVAIKPLPKKYIGHMGMDEAYRRRKNIVGGLKHDLDSMTKLAAQAATSTEAAMATITAVKTLITDISPYIEAYEKYGEMAILTFLTAYQNALLEKPVSATATVRHYMIQKLDFRTVEKANPNLYKGSLL